MKKTIFLITTCLLLTGCTANYNLEISDDNFIEKINGNILNKELIQEEDRTDINMNDYLLNNEQNVFQNNNSIFYNKTLNKKENSTDYEYDYTFNKNNFINSRILNECFDNFEFKEKDNKYYLSVSGNFKCYYTDEIKVNLTTKHKVTSHNAESKKKNTYIWNIKKENSDDVELFITIDKSKKATNISLEWSTLKTVGLIILLILSAIAIFIGKNKLKD